MRVVRDVKGVLGGRDSEVSQLLWVGVQCFNVCYFAPAGGDKDKVKRVFQSNRSSYSIDRASISGNVG